MKQFSLFIALFATFFCATFAQKQALILGYSQVENVYEDDNVKVELVRLDLRITNKTNKTIYIDKKSSFYYVNERAVCLYEGKETHYSNGTTIIEKDNYPIAPNNKFTLYYNAPVRGSFNAGGGTKGKGLLKLLKIKGTSTVVGKDAPLGDATVDFMGYIETLRYELANKNNQSAAKLHLTKDDSFLKVTVAINYTQNPKLEDFTPVSISSWVSDMVMSKYYVQGKDEFVKSNAVNMQGRMYNILHVFANSPFEYEEDESPLSMYIVKFDKGSFYVHQFNQGDDSDKKTKDTDELVSNFSESKPKYKNIFVWEGESNNWVQSMTDSYQKYLEEDGMKPKKAAQEAKKAAANAKKEQTLKP